MASNILYDKTYRQLHSKILSNHDFQYQQAIQIYKEKKELMQKKLAESLKKKNYSVEKTSYQQMAEDILNSLLSEDTRSAMAEAKFSATQVFDDIKFDSVDMNADFLDWFSEAIESAQKSEKTENSDKYTALFINRLETQLKKNTKFYNDYQSILKKAGYVAGGKGVKRTVAEAQKSSYIRRLLIDYINKQLKHSVLDNRFNINKEAYLQALKGEYYEEAVHKIMKKQLSPQLSRAKGVKNTTMQNKVLKQTGNWKAEGKSITSDILFDLGLGCDLDFIEKAMNKTYTETITPNIKKIEKLLENAANNFLGAQVKSFVLPKKVISYARNYPIGDREKLIENFLSNNQFKAYGLVGSIAFLGMKNNIIEALGKDNLLFATGNQIQWTYDFIANFRNLHFYLSVPVEKIGEGETATLRFKKSVELYNYAKAKSHWEDYYSYLQT